MKKMKKTIFLLFINLTIISFSYSQNEFIKSNDLIININNKTGGIQSISNATDKYQMNYILKSDGSQYNWQTEEFAWGLGRSVIKGDTIQWNEVSEIKGKSGNQIYKYKTKYFELSVIRKVNSKGDFTENYQFKNTTSNTIKLENLRINTPFNDNYPDSKTCVESRCNAHIWTGKNSSYVFAQRMGGEPPHLGLVLTEGPLISYEILNRDMEKGLSNVRGTIALNPENIEIKSGDIYTLSWVIFSCDSPSQFYNKAMSYGLVKVNADNYTIQQGEDIDVTFEKFEKWQNVSCTLNGQAIDFKQSDNKITIKTKTESIGEQIVELKYGMNKSTIANFYCISNIDSLIKKRMQFIVEKQQLNDTTDERNSAYLVYDNETHEIYKNEDARKSSDTNDGRERLGMGVVLCMYLQQHPDPVLLESVKRYYHFVRTKLQDKEYRVFSGFDKPKNRGYNYPWVANFYLELYKLTDNEQYVLDYYFTMRQFFKSFPNGFYAIGIPVDDGLEALKKAKRLSEYDTLLNDFKLTADKFIQNSIYYPKSEVNYEQSIVGPSVVFLLEMYKVTGNKKYLTEAEKQLVLLEAFAFDQPDYHLNEIAIRHWDGYWFGKKQFWGDIMPHYWSTISAEAFLHYAEIKGNNDYLNKAKMIVRNNLCQFFEDGSASCAYVYPAKVNGQKAAFFDPFANDQDWALMYYLQVMSHK